MDQVYKSHQNKSVLTEEKIRENNAVPLAKSLENAKANPNPEILQQPQNIRENIRENMPEDLGLMTTHKEVYETEEARQNYTTYTSKYQELSESTYQQTVTRVVDGQKVERLEDNSLLMQEVKGKLAELNTLLQGQAALSDDTIEDITREFTIKYDEVISKTDEYIKKRWPISNKGRDRMRMVKEINKSCKYERAQIRMAVREANTEKKAKALQHENLSLTYGDILKYCRRVTMKSSLSALSGGATSTVFKIKSDTEHRLFKKAARICKLDYDELTNSIEAGLQKEKEKNGMTNEVLVMTKFRDTLLNGIKEIIGDRVLTPEQAKNQAFGILDLFTCLMASECPDCFNDHAADLLAVDKTTPEGQAAIQRLTDKVNPYFFGDFDCPDFKPGTPLADNRTRVQTFAKAMRMNMFRDLTASITAIRNGIHANADMTMRNVATSRMAGLLHFSDNLVIKSENATIQTGNNVLDGITMTKAKGISLRALKIKIRQCRAEGNRIWDTNRYMTPQAAKQLMQLQLMDMICGQMDRHSDNLFVQYDEKALSRGELWITGFTGIDNDMAFGEIGEDDLLNGRNSMSFLMNFNDDLAIKHIDRETFDNIMGLTNEIVDHQMADMGLTAKELEALHTRIRVIQNHLRSQEKKPGFIINNFAELPQDRQKNLSLLYTYQEPEFNENGVAIPNKYKTSLFGNVASIMSQGEIREKN